MQTKKLLLMMGLASILSLTGTRVPAQSIDNFGQVIQISTDLGKFIGKPSWLIIIRDMDHGQNIPYLYDMTTGSNFWIALSYSKDYVIVASELMLNPYGRKISNFCHLESMGIIQHGTSMDVQLTGNLTCNRNTYRCNVVKFPDAGFNMGTQI